MKFDLPPEWFRHSSWKRNARRSCDRSSTTHRSHVSSNALWSQWRHRHRRLLAYLYFAVNCYQSLDILNCCHQHVMCLLERIVALLPWCSSVCLSGTDVHCDHTMHFNTDLSLWLVSPMFWAPWHQSMSTYSQPSFSSSTWKRGRIWMCKLGVISQEQFKLKVTWLITVEC